MSGSLVKQFLADVVAKADAGESLTGDDLEALGYYYLRLSTVTRRQEGTMSVHDEARLSSERYIAKVNAGEEPTPEEEAELEELTQRVKTIGRLIPRDSLTILQEHLEERLARGEFTESDEAFSLELKRRLNAVDVQMEADRIIARGPAGL